MATTNETSELFTSAVVGAMSTIVEQAHATDALLAEFAEQAHCEQCGSTDPEDVGGREEGRYYSGCCNERIILP